MVKVVIPKEGFWQGPGPLTIIFYCLVLGAFSLAVSYIAINGVPEGMFDFRSNKLPVEGKTVLVTGGSQGLGLELGNILSYKGANVILVARNSAKLEKAVEYIKKAASNPSKQRFHWISADLTSAEENTRLLSEATQWNNNTPPDIIWANAGSAYPGYFLDMPLETFRTQMDTNYWSAVYLARVALKSWLSSPVNDVQAQRESRRPGPRHFIMTSSVAAFCGLPGYTAYAPAKAAMRSFHDQLRAEVNLYNGYLSHPSNTTLPKIKVHTVFPGTILSPGLEQENSTKPEPLKMLEEGDVKEKPFDVAMAAIKGLEKGKSLVEVNWLGSLMRGSSLMGSVRDSGWKDLPMSVVSNIAWLFVAPDMESKVRKWAMENGMELKPRE